MLRIVTIATNLFDANCYLVSVPGSEKVLVVDPGLGAAEILRGRLEAHGQKVGAVLLTHGHADHVWNAAQTSLIGNQVPAPVFIPGPDIHWLDDPAGKLGIMASYGGLGLWQRPEIIAEVPTGSWQVLPEIYLQMLPSPGHSVGSAVFLVGGECQVDGEILELGAFSGDVVFAGSVGRTDLPGGDELEMRQSLRTLVNVLDPRTTLLPGHGPATRWGTEQETNPYVIRATQLG